MRGRERKFPGWCQNNNEKTAHHIIPLSAIRNFFKKCLEKKKESIQNVQVRNNDQFFIQLMAYLDGGAQGSFLVANQNIRNTRAFYKKIIQKLEWNPGNVVCGPDPQMRYDDTKDKYDNNLIQGLQQSLLGRAAVLKIERAWRVWLPHQQINFQQLGRCDSFIQEWIAVTQGVQNPLNIQWLQANIANVGIKYGAVPYQGP